MSEMPKGLCRGFGWGSVVVTLMTTMVLLLAESGNTEPITILNSSCLSEFFGSSTWWDSEDTALYRYWNSARAAAGMEPLTTDVLKRYFHLAKKPDRYRHTFMSGQQVQVGFCNDLGYIPVYKSANNFWRANLIKSCITQPKANRKNGWIGRQRDKRDLYNQALKSNETFLFTFVRDPFAHFISGYREAVQGTYDECCNSSWPESPSEIQHSQRLDRLSKMKDIDGIPRHEPCSPSKEILCPLFQNVTALGEHFLKQLFDCTLVSWYFVHWYPQVNYVYAFTRPPNFIGHLENLKDDWSRLCNVRKHLCPLPPTGTNAYVELDMNLGQHPKTSSDTLNAGVGLIKVLKENEKYAAGIRELLGPDYSCLL